VASTYNLMEPSYLRPFFFAQGLGELIWPSASVLSFYTEFLVIGMLLPYIDTPRLALPLSIGAIIMINLMLLMQCFGMASVFGPLLNSTTSPAFAMARMVSLGDFFERIESLITVVWIFGAGIKVCLFLWATAVGLAQLLNLKDFRSLVYPLGALMVAISIVSYESLIGLINVLTGSMIVFSISFLIVILLALYIVPMIKEYFRDGTSNAGQG
jgi:spore germination protein KB